MSAIIAEHHWKEGREDSVASPIKTDGGLKKRKKSPGTLKR